MTAVSLPLSAKSRRGPKGVRLFTKQVEFKYTARNQTGTFVSGTVEADDRAGAVKALGGKGLAPVKLGSAGKGLGRDISLRRGVPLMEKVVFARQLATMMGAGLPLTSSLHILAKQTKNKKMSETISDLAADVESGMSLGSSLEEHPRIFNRIMVAMIKAGEVGGILDEVLDRLATQLEREHSIIAKIRGAMIYPAVIIIALIVMFIIMMTIVVPQLTNIFSDLGTELPIMTKIVIAISNLFTHYGLFTAIGFVALVVGWFRFIRTTSGRHLWHRALLRIPVAGKMSQKLNVARFTRTLGALMSGGIPVVESLKIVSETSSNVLFKEELLKVADLVEGGVPISTALGESPHYPELVKEMIGVGEETGELDAILQKLATFYDEEIDNMTKNMTSIIEPVLLLLIGGGVGFLVIAILLPIYSIRPQ